MTDTGRTVYWYDGGLWTPSGYLIVRCTWHEACRALEEATRPLTLLKQPPPGRPT